MIINSAEQSEYPLFRKERETVESAAKTVGLSVQTACIISAVALVVACVACLLAVRNGNV